MPVPSRGQPRIARDTELTRPLADPAYFRRAFIEAGALCWPNGLELSAPGLHRKLNEATVGDGHLTVGDGHLTRDFRISAPRAHSNIVI